MSSGAAARILLVEDDENLRVALEDNLVDEGFDVVAVSRGAQALELVNRGGIALVILDIMLPDLDGYGVCRRLRTEGHRMPVLMLTARTLEDDFVHGFEAGADDYVAKPYRLRELLARLRALLRRTQAHGEPEEREQSIPFGGFVLERQARVLRDAEGREVALTRTEFDLLACLCENRGAALSRQQLLRAAWDPGVVVETRTVDNFVSNLKKKLGWRSSDPYRIATVRGVGYRMEIDE
jgi:DNA-binding response OmpR family regulator